MDINTYKQLLLDQRAEIEKILPENLVSRQEEADFEFDSPLAQIVIGVRRSGKSTMCHKALKQNHIDYAYVNFDDERLYDLKPEALNSVLEALYMVYGDFKYLFCDEIQNVPSWFLFINRLLRQKIRLIITGSNAKLLSSELSTHLTGRYHQIELFPFSFTEILAYKKISADDDSTLGVARRKTAFEEYLSQGGFPEMFEVKNKKAYIRNLFGAIITRDITQRFAVRYPETLRKIADSLTETPGAEINSKSLAQQFGVGSSHTVENYVGYLRQAYLLIGLQKFSFKSRERANNEKNYVVDTAFIAPAREGFSEQNFGWRLENIVCIELLRRRNRTFNDVYYYKNGYEIDFVLVSNNHVVELIQVSADISAAKTFNRETDALFRAAATLNCKHLTLITLNDDRTCVRDNLTIDIVSIVRWLSA